MTTIAPTTTVTTTPAPGGAELSTVTFFYSEARPYATVAVTMQLAYFPEAGVADFRSGGAPGEPVRIRPGQLLTVGEHTFEVDVPRGCRPVYPYLRRV